MFASYDLQYTQHCNLPELNEQQHAKATKEKIKESIQWLKKHPCRNIIKNHWTATNAMEAGRPVVKTKGVLTSTTISKVRFALNIN